MPHRLKLFQRNPRCWVEGQARNLGTDSEAAAAVQAGDQGGALAGGNGQDGCLEGKPSSPPPDLGKILHQGKGNEFSSYLYRIDSPYREAGSLEEEAISQPAAGQGSSNRPSVYHIPEAGPHPKRHP